MIKGMELIIIMINIVILLLYLGLLNMAFGSIIYTTGLIVIIGTSIWNIKVRFREAIWG